MVIILRESGMFGLSQQGVFI